MARHWQAAALCFLWPLAVRAEAEVCDETTMVQSAAMLQPAQMPGGVGGMGGMGGMPGLMPGGSIDPASMGNPTAAMDLSPLIEMVEVFDQLVNAFRNATVRKMLTEFVGTASSALQKKFGEVNDGIADSLVHAHAQQLGPQAAAVVSKMLMDLYNRMHQVKELIGELSEPLQPSLPSKFNATKIMDPEGLMGMLDFAFNNTHDFLEGHVNGSLTVEGDEDYCRTTRHLLRRLGLVGDFVHKMQKDMGTILEDQLIDESPMVIIAPDIIPNLREYSMVTIRSTVDMCTSFQRICNNAIHASIETLRENNVCKIDEAKILAKSASRSMAAPCGGLALLLLAALSLTGW